MIYVLLREWLSENSVDNPFRWYYIGMFHIIICFLKYISYNYNRLRNNEKFSNPVFHW